MYLTKCCHVQPETHLSNEGTGCFICPACSMGCNCYDTDDVKFKRTTIGQIKGFETPPQPQITKLSTTYKISHEGIEIKAEKGEDGRLTLIPRQTQYVNDGFVFKGSKPKTVREIGEILIKVSEL